MTIFFLKKQFIKNRQSIIQQKKEIETKTQSHKKLKKTYF